MSLVDIVAADVASATREGGSEPSYAAVFASIIKRISLHLDAQVVEQIAKALTIMEDGKPCPASQVSVGSFTIAAMAVSMMHDLLAGEPVPAAPIMVIHSFKNHQTKFVDISASSGG
jgi:hypothetical protein